MPKLFINGLCIEDFKENHSELEDDSYSFEIPGYFLLERKGTDKAIVDLFEEDAELLGKILPIDSDRLIGSKIRVYVQKIGKAKGA